MATSRITKSTEYVKHVFTESERLQMGSDLAASYTRLGAIEEEEQVVKAKFKERKTTIEQSIGSLSRDLGTGWTMNNVECRLEWDSPNHFEVSYIRIDTGETVKVRAMTSDERQMDLPLAGDVVVVLPAQVEESIQASADNIEAFFEKPAEELPAQENSDEIEEPVDPFTDPDPAAATEAVKAENDEAFGVDLNAPKKRGRPAKVPQGFDKPTNASAIADF